MKLYLFTALSTVEEVGLDVFQNWEQDAASSISDSVAICACSTLDRGS